MSLWYKNINEITFDDIEQFCRHRHREGPRLEYKGQRIPKDLPSLVAAFANTLGGMMLFGVDVDKATNEPIWPPCGMLADDGIEERLIALCRDNLYPPVRPQISPVLSSRTTMGTVIVVARIDESPEAPHADSKGRVYARTGNQNHPIDIAHIDRIQYLLQRRGLVDAQRRDHLEREIDRATRRLAESRLLLGEEAQLRRHVTEPPGPRGVPLRWASVIPFFPWQELCNVRECHNCLRFLARLDQSKWQGVPGGAIGIGSGAIGHGVLPITYGSISSNGHVFMMECAREVSEVTRDVALGRDSPRMVLTIIQRFAAEAFRAAHEFYKRPEVITPGYLLLSLGLTDVLDFRIVRTLSNAGAHGLPFVDEDFAADRTVPFHEFLDDPEAAAAPLFDDLKWGFDLSF
jgi:hypothetical protein